MEDYALIIGIDHYEDTSMPNLGGAVNDAWNFYTWAISSQGGKLKKNNCKLLCSNAGLTKLFLKEIEDTFAPLFQKAKVNKKQARRFYFYFSGHGLGVALDEVSLVLTDWNENLANRGISSKKFHDSILNSGVFNEILFFLDCCRSRKVNVKPQGTGIYVPGINPEAKTTQSFTAFATLHWTKAYEDDIKDKEGNTSRRNGYFTKALLDGLQGRAATATGEVTLGRLKGHLREETSKLAQEKNRQQMPRFSSTFDNDDTVIATIEFHGFELGGHNVQITFTDETNGPYILEDKELNEKRWTKEQGIWKLSLKPGLHLLTDLGTQKSLPIKIKIHSNHIHDVTF